MKGWVGEWMDRWVGRWMGGCENIWRVAEFFNSISLYSKEVEVMCVVYFFVTNFLY